MGFDTSEFKEYMQSIKNLQKLYNQWLKQFLLKCAMECLAKTKKRTPVDTGELRRNWYITGVIRKGADELVVYLYNTKDYSSYVEYGHQTPSRSGWVEGYYMATISVEELNRKIPQRYDRELAKFLQSLGVM